MARSNQGGTRGFIRGRVANDLYQVTVKANGRRVQLVRAVEESRVNNNTLEQALSRMRMALLMGALKDLKAIVDHSWEGIPYGQLSIAHFVRENMQPLIADCKENWSVNNAYCYPVKGVSEMRIGAFLIASGTLSTPPIIRRGVRYSFGTWFPFTIEIGHSNPTFGQLREALGLNADDYITLLCLCGLDVGSVGIFYQALFFTRLYLAKGVSDATVISSDNVADMFTYEGNTDYEITINDSSGSITANVSCSPDRVTRQCLLSSVILSRWSGKVWQRNTARFAAADGSESPNFEYQSPRVVFKSWYESYDPDGDDSGVYPGKL